VTTCSLSKPAGLFFSIIFGAIVRRIFVHRIWELFGSLFLVWFMRGLVVMLPYGWIGLIPIEHREIEQISFWGKKFVLGRNLIFLELGFKLGDDFLGIAHLLHCDPLREIWKRIIELWSSFCVFFGARSFLSRVVCSCCSWRTGAVRGRTGSSIGPDRCLIRPC
jgi:hypothetical protein